MPIRRLLRHASNGDGLHSNYGFGGSIGMWTAPRRESPLCRSRISLPDQKEWLRPAAALYSGRVRQARVRVFMNTDSTRKVPALVVSGFLGSGKTTLVRRLLDDAQRQGIRMAVVSNEFGALGIDRTVLGADPGAIIELEGGCVCCQLSSELVETLQRLHDEVDPDRIVVETSGLALPSETLLSFWREPVASWVGDDMAVTVVDAAHVLESDDLSGTFEDQVGAADLLLLNKIDLLQEGELAEVERRLRAIEPETPLIHTVHGDVDPDLLFLPAAAARPRVARPHSHETFTSEEITFAPGTPSESLQEEIRALGALRAKGFVATAEGVCLVQGVGRRVAVEPVRLAPPAEMIGRVVVIRRA